MKRPSSIASRLRYGLGRKAKASKGAGMIPVITADRDTLQLMRSMLLEWGKRIKRGHELLSLEFAKLWLEEVQALAPDIVSRFTDKEGSEFVAEPFSYADELRIGKAGWGKVDGVDTFIVTIYYPAEHERRHWAAVVAKSEGRLQPQTMQLEPSEKANDMRLGMQILRAEYGIEQKRNPGDLDPLADEPSKSTGPTQSRKPSWRPGYDRTKKSVAKLQQKFVDYVQTGNEGEFDLPRDVADVTLQELEAGSWFQEWFKLST